MEKALYMLCNIFSYFKNLQQNRSRLMIYPLIVKKRTTLSMLRPDFRTTKITKALNSWFNEREASRDLP